MKNYFLLLIALFAFTKANAQTHFGFNIQSVIPYGQYAQATDDIGFGGGANLWIPFGEDIPVYAGLDFGFNVLGGNTQYINQEAKVIGPNGQILDRIPINYKVRTRNNSFHTHLGIRAKAPFEYVQPYVEGLVGFNYLYTRTRITNETDNRQSTTDDDDNARDEEISASTQLSDFVFSYGGGGGLMIGIGRGVALDLRVDYLLGSKGKYYRDVDIDQWEVEITTQTNEGSASNQANVNTEATESKTDMFYASLGLSISF